MLNRLLAGATTLMILGTPLVAAAQAAQEKAPPAGQQAAPPTGRQPQQFVNIRLELTINIVDPRGTAVVPARVVSMFLVDREPGGSESAPPRIRWREPPRAYLRPQALVLC